MDRNLGELRGMCYIQAADFVRWRSHRASPLGGLEPIPNMCVLWEHVPWPRRNLAERSRGARLRPFGRVMRKGGTVEWSAPGETP